MKVSNERIIPEHARIIKTQNLTNVRNEPEKIEFQKHQIQYNQKLCKLRSTKKSGEATMLRVIELVKDIFKKAVSYHTYLFVKKSLRYH